MATSSSEGPVIAVVGTVQAGIAALINTIVAVAYATPDGAPPTKIVVIDTKDQSIPRGDAPYPLDAVSPAELHPFSRDRPPEGFPTFGEYVERESKDDPGLRDALNAPVYRQVNAYLDYLLELASISFADQVSVDVNRGTIREVVQAAPDGPAVIHFVDGTSLSVAKLILAKQPPHMGGTVPSDHVTAGAPRPAPPPSSYPANTREYFWERIVGGYLGDADAAALLEFIAQAARTRNGGTTPGGAAASDDFRTLTDFKEVVLDINQRGDAGERVALAALVGGDCAEAARRFDAVVAIAGDDTRRALWIKGALFASVDPAVTRDAWERLLQVDPDFHYARCAYGRLLERMGDISGAEAAFREVISRAADDPASQAMGTDFLGTMARSRKDYESATHLFERSLQLYRQLGDARGERITVEMLGRIAFLRGEPAIAEAYLNEALELCERAQDAVGMKRLLERLALSADQRGDAASAGKLRARLASL
jgi:tetratricopeptide (TPR) repeat protein